MAKAYSTIGTTLSFGTSADNLSKLTKIKSYPDLGGAPDNLETTDLEDTFQTFVPGVQAVDQMEFTSNYTPEAYEAVKATERKDGFYKLEFGSSGAEGYSAFTWQGQHVVYVNGGDVNAVREMTIVVTPSTEITKEGSSEG